MNIRERIIEKLDMILEKFETPGKRGDGELYTIKFHGINRGHKEYAQRLEGSNIHHKVESSSPSKIVVRSKMGKSLKKYAKELSEFVPHTELTHRK